MIRNSIVAAATAGLAAFTIWFQATQTVSHELKSDGGAGREISQVEPGTAETPAPDEGGEGSQTHEKDESGSGTDDHTGKPGEVEP